MTDPLGLTYPFTGPWLTQNSPASRVPSHGTTRFATAHAIDFVPVDDQGRSAPFTVTSLLHAEPAAHFPGFGRPVLAPIAGTVVAVHDGEEDHDAYRGFPSLGYAWTQRRRLAAGWVALAGNHVMLRTEAGPVVVLCHLQQHSILVASGQRVRSGDLLGRCGNSGNSTEPHLHLQVIDQPRVHEAAAVPFVLDSGLPRNGEIVRVGSG
ncbi:MAG TPA: M23 family metallopeptidase [Ruania sp.]|nr:M23 family metallopeptidase [Ruania sp.]